MSPDGEVSENFFPSGPSCASFGKISDDLETFREFTVPSLVRSAGYGWFPGCPAGHLVSRLSPDLLSRRPSSGFGVVGDSSSDEFRADDNRGGAYAATTLNWVELLVRYRGLDAGPWATWGGSRRTGYEHNWARSGARAADLISQGQAAGLAQQVAEGRIAWAVLMVGTNDFGPSTSRSIYNGTLSGAALTAMIDGIVASVAQAVDTVRAGGPVLLLVTNVPTTAPSTTQPCRACFLIRRDDSSSPPR